MNNNVSITCLPEHGGNLSWASQAFNREPSDWIDLSTGISPWAWNVPTIPDRIWRDLPGSDKHLLQSAAKYFGCSENQLFPAPGSQYFVTQLPKCLAPGSVAIPKVGYQEHRIAWLQAGHDVKFYENIAALDLLVETKTVNYIVVINPNNPSAEMVERKHLLALAERINNYSQERNQDSALVVDEAFIDLWPKCSLAPNCHNDNILVLRSMGKYFGLAGIRLGFLLASPKWRSKLSSLNITWQINHPAMYIGALALDDLEWVNMQRQRILDQSNIMHQMLRERYQSVRSVGLFLSVFGKKTSLFDDFLRLAQQGILTRFVDLDGDQAMLRFGLPGAHFNDVRNRILEL